MPITINDCRECGNPPVISIDENSSFGYPRHSITCNERMCCEFGVVSTDWDIVVHSWNQLNPQEANGGNNADNDK